MIFKPHTAKQETVLFSEKSIVIAATGIQWGKTKSGALWMKMMMHTHINHDDNFLITSPTFRIFKQSTLPPFLHFMKDLGNYNKADECFEMYSGGKCWFRTGMNPDSIVGITNIRAILCDEGGLYSLYFWENIQGRAAFCKAPIRIVTSPYAQNWLYKDYIRPKMKDPGAMPHVEIVQATSSENPHFPKDRYEALKQTMDPRRFNMMFGGEFNKMEGVVYDVYDYEFNSADWFEFPKDTRFFGGVDWGYTDPWVLVVHAILPNGLRFQVSETYKSGLTIDKITEICQQKKSVFGIERFYCGPDQPGYIEYLNRNKCPAVGATNDIRLGIDTVYEQIKTRSFKIIKGTSPHTIDELETYHYPNPKDLKPDQDGKDMNPVGQNDHALDAVRYLVIMTTRSNNKLTPKVPSGPKIRTQADRIKRLLERKEPRVV